MFKASWKSWQLQKESVVSRTNLSVSAFCTSVIRVSPSLLLLLSQNRIKIYILYALFCTELSVKIYIVGHGTGKEFLRVVGLMFLITYNLTKTLSIETHCAFQLQSLGMYIRLGAWLQQLEEDNTASGVARICCEEGQSWKFGHGALTVNFRAGCSSGLMTNSFVTNAVLIERAVSCWHLHHLISHTTQYLDSWLSDLLQSELKMKLLEVERARDSVPHSWRGHCIPPIKLAVA